MKSLLIDLKNPCQLENTKEPSSKSQGSSTSALPIISIEYMVELPEDYKKKWPPLPTSGSVSLFFETVSCSLG